MSIRKQMEDLLEAQTEKQKAYQRRKDLRQAKMRAAQQETLASDHGKVTVKPAPEAGRSTIHTADWSGTYRKKGALFILTNAHRGNPPGELKFGMADRTLILKHLTGE